MADRNEPCELLPVRFRVEFVSAGKVAENCNDFEPVELGGFASKPVQAGLVETGSGDPGIDVERAAPPLGRGRRGPPRNLPGVDQYRRGPLGEQFVGGARLGPSKNQNLRVFSVVGAVLVKHSPKRCRLTHFSHVKRAATRLQQRRGHLSDPQTVRIGFHHRRDLSAKGLVVKPLVVLNERAKVDVKLTGRG